MINYIYIWALKYAWIIDATPKELPPLLVDCLDIVA